MEDKIKKLTKNSAYGVFKKGEKMLKGRLTLTAREGDVFKIGDNIELCVGEKVGGSKMKLRFEAPMEVNIEHKRISTEDYKKNPRVILRKKNP